MDSIIKIHLADDHQVLIDGLLAVLHNNPRFLVVGHSLNGQNLVQDVKNDKTEVLIMDINMPEKDGIQVLKEFNQKGFTCKVIILSSYDEAKLIKEVIKLGASGYLTKQCAGEHIIDSILAVAAGNQYFSTAIKDKVFDTYSGNQVEKQVRIKDVLETITERELQILKLISQEKSGKDISEQLHISTNTVETHRKNLMRKINVKSSIGLALFATNNNLIQPK